MRQVLVRWRMHGGWIVDGLAYPREPGDEDMMAATEARDLARVGYVTILDESPESRRAASPEGVDEA
jgi:hypothetical protein